MLSVDELKELKTKYKWIFLEYGGRFDNNNNPIDHNGNILKPGHLYEGWDDEGSEVYVLEVKCFNDHEAGGYIIYGSNDFEPGRYMLDEDEEEPWPQGVFDASN